LELFPKSFRTHFNMAKLDGKMGHPKEMIEHLKKSIELNPKFVVGYLYLANAYLEQGNLQQAMELAKKGIELGPEPSLAPFGHYILADVYKRLGRSRDAAREMAVAQRLQSS
ncbi:MAG: tetratricopeptide repeat protein, partial [Acidobacteriota bacterium]